MLILFFHWILIGDSIFLTINCSNLLFGRTGRPVFLQMRGGGQRGVLYLGRVEWAEQGGFCSVPLVLQEAGEWMLKCKRRVTAWYNLMDMRDTHRHHKLKRLQNWIYSAYVMDIIPTPFSSVVSQQPWHWFPTHIYSCFSPYLGSLSFVIIKICTAKKIKILICSILLLFFFSSLLPCPPPSPLPLLVFLNFSLHFSFNILTNKNWWATLWHSLI